MAPAPLIAALAGFFAFRTIRSTPPIATLRSIGAACLALD